MVKHDLLQLRGARIAFGANPAPVLSKKPKMHTETLLWLRGTFSVRHVDVAQEAWSGHQHFIEDCFGPPITVQPSDLANSIMDPHVSS
jgi:hypothetical protein